MAVVVMVAVSATAVMVAVAGVDMAAVADLAAAAGMGETAEDATEVGQAVGLEVAVWADAKPGWTSTPAPVHRGRLLLFLQQYKPEAAQPALCCRWHPPSCTG